MLSLLRYLYWDMSTRSGRYHNLQFLINNFPGTFGIKLRYKLYKKYFGSMGVNVTIHPGARVRNCQKLYVGDYAQIGECAIIQATGEVHLGNHVLLGPDVKIWSANHKFDDITVPIIDQGYENKKVVVSDGCWIGANSFIMPGVTLGKGVVVSAGAVVGAKNYPPYKILAGNPARIIGTREQEKEPK